MTPSRPQNFECCAQTVSLRRLTVFCCFKVEQRVIVQIFNEAANGLKWLPIVRAECAEPYKVTRYGVSHTGLQNPEIVFLDIVLEKRSRSSFLF